MDDRALHWEVLDLLLLLIIYNNILSTGYPGTGGVQLNTTFGFSGRNSYAGSSKHTGTSTAALVPECNVLHSQPLGG